jgi:phospho-N-acetylmuramoyl-pentapeptide-transferase
MNEILTLPVRPDISLIGILGYALFAFAFTLVFTPSFVSFLHRNKVGKQLRVETVDGREASIFRMLHQSKHGTPTMGGVLIWGSIVLTVLVSRLLSYFGTVEHSLFQRGQVYLPLFILLSMGILGAIDDYLNIIGSNEELWKRILKPIRIFFAASTLLMASIGLTVALHGIPQLFFNPSVALTGYVFLLMYIGAMVAVVDDVVKRHSRRPYKKGGIAAIPKFLSLFIIALLGAAWFYFRLDYDFIHIPYIGNFTLGLWYIPVFVFILVGTANAVNVTDGLDGLAGGLLAIAFAAFGILAYAQGLSVLAGFSAVCVGAIAAFLWHNVPPALFFMGDTGALALGGTLAVMAMMIDQALVLPLIGFIFVIETLSVLIQLTSKKLRNGKKVFLAAPIHHHFEALQWGESKVTMRFWIVGIFMAFLGIIVGLAG